MTERPILFSGTMVRAILEGKKTQTRRVIKPQPDDDCLNDGGWPITLEQCPYGVTGDRLWAREKWCMTVGQPLSEQEPIRYAADFDPASRGPWRPSIHMPRWASRITLEITDIRVQRVQEISEDDAKNEGLRRVTDGLYTYWRKDEWTKGPAGFSSAVGAFRDLWDSINAKRGHVWDANPWVWAITFKVVK